MSVRVLVGDVREVLRTLPNCSVQCAVTSPPYFGLRSYLPDGHPDKRLEIGLERTPDAYVAEMVAVFREVRRVLRDDGTLWLNIGDSYCSKPNGPCMEGSGLQGSLAPHAEHRIAHGRRSKGIPPGFKHKDLFMIPARVAIALQSDGWWLRSDIIWAKPNPMPESVTDRPTSAHEHVFLLTKSARYFYDADAIREMSVGQNEHDLTGGRYGPPGQTAHTGSRSAKRKRGTPPYHARYASSDQSGLDTVGRGQGRNARNVWSISPQPYSGAHFATMPPELAERCIRAGSGPRDTVLDPFGGAGTTGLVADRLHRNAILVELNPGYANIIRARVSGDARLFAEVAD